MRIRTIRKSGYFVGILELRPVFRCQESSCRSCCALVRGLFATLQQRFRETRESIQCLNAIAGMAGADCSHDEHLLPVHLRRDYGLTVDLELRSERPRLKRRQARMKMIDDVLRQNWSTLHGLSLESPALHFAKTAPIEPSCWGAKKPDSGRTAAVCCGRVYKTDQNAKLKSDILNIDCQIQAKDER
jgi:hypothetical protein